LTIAEHWTAKRPDMLVERIVCTTVEPAATVGNTGKVRPNTEKPRRQEGQRGRIRMESSTWMLAECSKPARASLLIDQV